jgi:uncharacterized membrane protein YqjE
VTDMATRPNAESESVASLVHDAGTQINQLVRQEVRLAVLEMRDKGKRLGTGAGLASAGAVTAFFAGAAFIAAAILGIAVVLPGWAATLIIAGALLLIAVMAGIFGGLHIRRTAGPMPRTAAEDVRQDIALIKERGHR